VARLKRVAMGSKSLARTSAVSLNQRFFPAREKKFRKKSRRARARAAQTFDSPGKRVALFSFTFSAQRSSATNAEKIVVSCSLP
jgi:hypothetical protein